MNLLLFTLLMLFQNMISPGRLITIFVLLQWLKKILEEKKIPNNISTDAVAFAYEGRSLI